MCYAAKRVLTVCGGAQQPTALQQITIPQMETSAAKTARTARIASHATAKSCNSKGIVSEVKFNNGIRKTILISYHCPPFVAPST